MTAKRSPMRHGSPTMNALAWLEAHDGVAIDEHGFATRAIYGDLGITMTAASSAIGKCKSEGWVLTETNGKRTYSIELTDAGRRFLAEYRGKVTYTNGTNGAAAAQAAAPEVTASEEGGVAASLTTESVNAAPAVEGAGTIGVTPSDDDDGFDGPGRPGRFAARLEKSIPEIVARAVDDALHRREVERMEKLGFGDVTGLKLSVAALAEQVRTLEVTNEALRDDLRGTRNEMHSARASLNRVLGKSEEGKKNSNALKPSELHTIWRDLAADFIAQGGKIFNTRGGHQLWLWTDGRRVYSAKSPSDFRLNHILRGELHRYTGFQDPNRAEKQREEEEPRYGNGNGEAPT